MNNKQHNVVGIIYNREHTHYLYGAFHIVRGESPHQWTTNPFVVSKHTATGEVFVYGSVLHMLLKVLLTIERLKEFSSRADAVLARAGLPTKERPLPVGTPVADHIMDDQEELIEEVILVTSVRVRTQSEVFPDRLVPNTVLVYGYDGAIVDSIQIRHIGNFLAHNRYICVRGEHIVDLYSDERILSGIGQIGLKLNFLEYITQIETDVRSITVKNLLAYLHCKLEQLSSSSGNKEMVDLHQNLYTLGGLVGRQSDTIVPGPLQTILSRAAANYLERKYPNEPPEDEDRQRVIMKCTTPRFGWVPDLDEQRILVSLFVNDDPETLIMDWGEFFREMEAAYGEVTLLEAAGFPTPSHEE